jgi:hypothetical protein
MLQPDRSVAKISAKCKKKFATTIERRLASYTEQLFKVAAVENALCTEYG